MDAFDDYLYKSKATPEFADDFIEYLILMIKLFGNSLFMAPFISIDRDDENWWPWLGKTLKKDTAPELIVALSVLRRHDHHNDFHIDLFNKKIGNSYNAYQPS